MKRLVLIAPEEIEPVEGQYEDQSSFLKLTSHSEGPEISVLKPGTELISGAKLSIRPFNGHPGGRLNRLSPGGLSTRRSLIPYEFGYSFEEEPGDLDWVGLSELGVRKFMRFTFEDPTESGVNGTKYLNLRVFSFNGELFMLVESKISFGFEYAMVPKLLKYNEAAKQFELFHVFQDPVYLSELSSQFKQEGSPDYFVFNGRLHVGYRKISKESQQNEICIWQADENWRWRKTATVPIVNSFQSPEVDRFRIRFATSPDSVMFVYYAIVSENRIPTSAVEKHDLRSYISHDGVNFRTRINNFDNIIVDDEDKLFAIKGSMNMAYMFIPEFEGIGDRSFYSGFNEKFALYYDRQMASFVILKSGDPGKEGNDTWLMGAKTSDGDYSNWENCVLFDLSLKHTNLAPDEPEIDRREPSSNQLLDQSTYLIRIKDLDVVETVHGCVLACLCEEYNGVDSRNGMVVTEFEFIPVEQIESGSVTFHYRVGSKSHPDWSFVVRHFDPDATAPVCGGSYSTKSVNKFGEVSLGTWRGQVVSLVRSDFQPRIVLYNQWQNIRERSSYQFAYSATFGPVSRFTFVQAPGGTYIPAQFKYNFPAAAGGLFVANSGDVIVPDLLSLYGDTKYSKVELKVRFKLAVVGGSNAEVIALRVEADDRHLELKMSLEVGEIFFFSDVGAGSVFYESIAVAVTDWSTPYEFIVALKKEKVKVYYRQEDEVNFTFVGETEPPTSAGFLGISYLIVGATGGANAVDVYDLQVSTYGHTHRGVFVDRTLFNSNELSPSQAPFLPTADIPIELVDGSVIRIRGGQETRHDLSYTYEQIGLRGLNSVRNLVDDVSDRLFDMTHAHSLEDYCHCYEVRSVAAEDVTKGVQVIFRKAPQAWGAFSLINIFGVHCFDLITGIHNGTEWSEVVSLGSYKVVRKELTVTEVIGGAIIVDDIFDQGQIVGYCLMKYRLPTEGLPLGTYVDTFKVVRNFAKVIVLDKPVGDSEGYEFHLFMTSASYQLPSAALMTAHTVTHVGLKMYGVPGSDLIGLGEFIVGEAIDLAPYANTMEATMSDSVTVNTGEYGLTFNKGQTYRPAVESFKIAASTQGGMMNLTHFLQHAHRKEKLMALVEQRSNGSNWTWPVTKGDISYGSMDYKQDIEVNLMAQNYFARPNRKVTYEKPTLSLIYVKEFTTGVPINITASSIDPAGGLLTYKWFVNEVEIPGATTSSLMYPINTSIDSQSFKCIVTSSVSGLSSVAYAYVYRSEYPYPGEPDLVLPVGSATGAAFDIEITYPGLAGSILPNYFLGNLTVRADISGDVTQFLLVNSGATGIGNQVYSVNISGPSSLVNFTLDIFGGGPDPVTIIVIYEDVFGSIIETSFLMSNP